jgi:hypothetical protein
VKTKLIQGLALALFPLVVAGCGKAYPERKKLSKDYEITTSSPGSSYLADASGRILLGPSIQSWKLRGQVVVGEVTEYRGSNPDLKSDTADLGLFIFDIDTGRIDRALSPAEYERRIKALGLLP